MVFYSGHLYSDDTATKIISARNLLVNGSFAISPSGPAWGFSGRGGYTFPHFSIGSILNCIPAVLIYTAATSTFEETPPHYMLSALMTLQNVIYTAGIGIMLYLIFVRFGVGARYALLFSICCIAATELLHYSSTGWSEPAALFWGLAGFLLLFFRTDRETDQRENTRAWILWGVCTSIASTIRMEYLLFFLFFALVYSILQRKAIPSAILGTGITLTSLAAHLWFNHYRYGSWFDFGYFGSSASSVSGAPLAPAGSAVREILHKFISTGYLSTAFDTFISFGRVHWFWAATLMALYPLALHKNKLLPSPLRALAISTGMYLLVIPAFGTNSWCWANRYLYPVIPFVILPVFYLYYTGKLRKRPVQALSFAGGIIALTSTLVNSHYVQELQVLYYGKTNAMKTGLSSLRDLPFFAHCKLLPEFIRNTAHLFTGNFPTHSWEILRTSCLDIWPVGLVGSGTSPVWALTLWTASLLPAVFFMVKSFRLLRSCK